jgi:hypothetical protein
MPEKKIVSYLLTIVLFAIFSLPMACIEFVPLWLYETRYYGSYGPLYYFSIAVSFLSLISPWVLLSMAVIFRTKGMRTRTYVATGLFAWAVATQMLYVIMYFIRYYDHYYILRPNWP